MEIQRWLMAALLLGLVLTYGFGQKTRLDPLPDLAILDIKVFAPELAKSGDAVEADIIVMNESARTDAGGALTLELTVDFARDYNCRAPQGTTKQVSEYLLRHGQLDIFKFHFSVCGSGDYVIQAKVQLSGEERRYDNNQMEKRISINITPENVDLRFSQDLFTFDCIPLYYSGEDGMLAAISCMFQLENGGSVPVLFARGKNYVHLRLDPPTGKYQTKLMNTTFDRWFWPGKHPSNEAPWYFFEGFDDLRESGVYIVTLTVDPDNLANETDENNSVTLHIPVDLECRR